MRIRDLTSADLERMWAINQANVPALGEETSDSLDQIMEWSSMAIGVDVDDTLVGFCLVLDPDRPYPSPNYLWFQERYTNFVYLDRVGFAAEYRSQGYGAALYAEVERRAGLSQRSSFTLEVNLDPPNDGSIRFHQRLGFVEVGRQWTPSGKLVSLMAKSLVE
ncbi:MAG: GNAT family N-acetyltransferase [Actinomycetota bacterium]